MVTEDGNCFTSQNLCANHVREAKLNKDATETVERSQFAKELGDDEGSQSSGEGETQKPISKMNKAELALKAAELEITVPANATNKEVIALIEAVLNPSEDATPAANPDEKGDAE